MRYISIFRSPSIGDIRTRLRPREYSGIRGIAQSIPEVLVLKGIFDQLGAYFCAADDRVLGITCYRNFARPGRIFKMLVEHHRMRNKTLVGRP